MFIFARCLRSSAAVTPDKYELDIIQVATVFIIRKNWENNGTEIIGLVTPTPGHWGIIKHLWSKMEWCRFAPFHFAPQCHFVPTYHVPFCPRDYVWRKRIMSTTVSLVTQLNNVNMRTRGTWLHSTTCNGSTNQYGKSTDVETRVNWFIKRVKFRVCEILKAWSIASLISRYDAEKADDRNQVDVKMDPRQALFEIFKWLTLQ